MIFQKEELMENEQQQVKLGHFGMVDIVYPKSITILLDIVFEQSSTNGSRAKFGRLAAAAIGVLCDIISAGSKCLVMAGSKIPSNQEVEERENFLSDPVDLSSD